MLLQILSSHWLPTPPNDTDAVATVIDVVGTQTFLLMFVSFFLMQCALFKLTPRLLSPFVPAAKLADPKTERALSSFVASAAHHIFVVPISVYALWHFAAGRGAATHLIALACPLSLAYLLMDLALYAIPEAVEGKSWEYVIHHGSALVVTLGIAFSPPRILRFAPALLFTESSSIPFCISNIAGKSEAGATVAVVTQVMFAVLFVLGRLVNLPATVAALYLGPEHARDRDLVGPVGFAILALLIAMQVMWFSLILKSAHCKRICLGGGSRGAARAPASGAPAGGDGKEKAL